MVEPNPMGTLPGAKYLLKIVLVYILVLVGKSVYKYYTMQYLPY
jgi:hypothetical protein